MGVNSAAHGTIHFSISFNSSNSANVWSIRAISKCISTPILLSFDHSLNISMYLLEYIFQVYSKVVLPELLMWIIFKWKIILQVYCSYYITIISCSKKKVSFKLDALISQLNFVTEHNLNETQTLICAMVRF